MTNNNDLNFFFKIQRFRFRFKQNPPAETLLFYSRVLRSPLLQKLKMVMTVKTVMMIKTVILLISSLNLCKAQVKRVIANPRKCEIISINGTVKISPNFIKIFFLIFLKIRPKNTESRDHPVEVIFGCWEKKLLKSKKNIVKNVIVC